MRSGAALLVACVSAFAGGCSLPSEHDGARATDPGRRVRYAAQKDPGDESASSGLIRDLISTLDSDDPAARMVASTRLRRETGQDFGYDATAPEPDRREAADRWQAWYHREYGGSGGRSQISAGSHSADDSYNPSSPDADPEGDPSP